ncbi:MAG TPA: hypothetical protein VD833_09530 [Vicinamibacterales bacterium]|nr:hypothetical protein [Vicinamibacterales bacterium]
MRVTAALLAIGLLTCAGCATMDGTTTTGTPPGNTPVGTTGTTGPSGPVEVDRAGRGELPVGQQIDVRLQDRLSSDTAQPEQRFQTTTLVNLEQDGRVLVPAGSTVRGVVSSVESAGRVDRSGRMTLAFDQLAINGREYPIRALATQAFESGGIREEAGTIGAAGAVGAIVGGIIGGLSGALIGAAVGGGGVIAATEGKDVVLPAGTIIRIRLDTPVQLR